MFAATAAGLYEKVEDAMHCMGQGFESEYFPDIQRIPIYANRYEEYKRLGSFIEMQAIE
jgi:L-ribulokinase